MRDVVSRTREFLKAWVSVRIVWTCTNCWMCFTRRWNVGLPKRRLSGDDPNLHRVQESVRSARA
jgi:hypothetical protein